MAQDYTTTALLASIRRRASVPNTSVSGSADSDLLAYANEELQLRLVSDIMKVREEYFVRDYDYTIVASQTRYRIPVRAIGQKLRHVSLVDSSGGITNLPRVEPTRLEEWVNNNSSLFGWYAQGNDVVLAPTATTTATTLRLSYFIRPNQLVSSGTQAITAINTGTKTLTVASTTGFTTSLATDFVSNVPGFESLAIDQTPSSVTSTTLVYPNTLPTTLAVGDYVVLAQQSPIPQIPEPYHSVLAQRVAARYLEAMGKPDEAGAAMAALVDMEQRAMALISPRSDGNAQKIVSQYGLLGGGWRYRIGGL